MNNTMGNNVFSVIIRPTSNAVQIDGSILPDRFVSGSSAQQNPILSGDFGSTSCPTRQFNAIIYPDIYQSA